VSEPLPDLHATPDATIAAMVRLIATLRACPVKTCLGGQKTGRSKMCAIDRGLLILRAKQPGTFAHAP
jgi:hypothetical protein